MFNTPAIILRRRDYSDYDLILDFFTADGVKLSAIAKYARKSRKRFAGALELFSCLDTVLVRPGKKTDSRLFFLKEVGLTHPFAGIRSDIEKTAYASYWSEIINRWVEEGGRQEGVFPLFFYVLSALDKSSVAPAHMSLLFQVRFLSLAGIAPDFSSCVICRDAVDPVPEKDGGLFFDTTRGGLLCPRCRSQASAHRLTRLSPGTVKLLLWLQAGDLQQAGRIQSPPFARGEALAVMEGFVAYHLSTEIKSLDVLQKIRKWRESI